jgi:hypothetical protein
MIHKGYQEQVRSTTASEGEIGLNAILLTKN